VPLDWLMMKLRFGAILLGWGVLLSGCGDKKDDEKKSFALVTTGAVGFWKICKKGGEDAGAELGVQVETLMPDGSTEQRKALEDLLSKGVDGISVAAIDPENLGDILDEVAENALLITMDTDAPSSKRQVYIGLDNYEAGWMCGELVKEALPDGGEVILFIGRLEQDNAKRRRQGVIDCLMDREKDSSRFDPPGEIVKGENYTVLATRTDEIDFVKAKENVEDELTKNPDVDAMVGLFAYNPPIILDVLKGRGDLGKVKIIGFDENEVTLQGIVDGQIHGTVVQDPYEYGNRSIKVLHALSKGDDSVIPENKLIDIPARLIRKDNVEAFWRDLNEKLGK
jgi:ribose transport system substrate-binding protein